MADHVKVQVYLRAEEARKLKGNGITDIPTWVRNLTRDKIQELPTPPAPDAPKDPYLWESGS